MFFKNYKNINVVLKVLVCGAIAHPLWVGALTDEETVKKFKDLTVGIEAMQEKQAKHQGESDKLEAKIDKKSDKSEVKDLVDKLQKQIVQLTSALEANKVALTTVSKELESFKQSSTDKNNAMVDRLIKLEPQKVNIDGQDFLIDLDELRAYEDGLKMLRENDYRAAKKSFTGFLSTYPQSVLLASAHFFLGSANKGLNDCKESILAWQLVVTKFSSYSNAPAALMNIGTCQVELKDRVSAKRTFESIVEKFPTSEAAQTAKNSLLLMR